MSTTHQTRPAVDLAPDRDRRPRLALALALLSIPGVTIAWDLPAGGLYTGIPLAIAAITVGLRARQAPRGRTTAHIALAIAALALLSVVAFIVANPQ
jgi:predicted methyltransferase